MNLKLKNDIQLFLNNSNRKHIYNFLSTSLIIGGFLNLITRKSELETNLNAVLTLTIFLFVLGLIIKVIVHLNLSKELKDNLILAFIIITIPVITLQFIKYGSITVWAFPFVLVIIFTMFNNRKMLIYLSLSIFLTQTAVWILAPNVSVNVEPSDHFARILLYSFAICFAFYVNKIYLTRLRENSKQLLIQKSIAEISTDLITVNCTNIDEKIESMLKKSSETINVDRAHVFIFDKTTKMVKESHSWCNENCGIDISSIQSIEISAFPWLIQQLSKNDVVFHISGTEILSKEAVLEKKILVDLNVKSLIGIPFFIDNDSIGFLGFFSAAPRMVWSEDHKNVLKIMSNITANALLKIKAEKTQNYLAYYDQLTGLPNRILFKDRLNNAISVASRNNNVLAVMFVDLDSFKNINDTLGHENGDIILKMTASRLTETLRKSDTISRFGGDEFLILINNISTIDDINTVGKNVLSIFKNPFNINGHEIYVTVSAGISVYPEDGIDDDSLIKNADIAMYNAKESGKKQFKLCSSNMKNDVRNSVVLTNSMHRIQERDELELYYQPQVDTVSEKIIGVEALLRWNHPQLGRIPPAVFIPLAEKTGHIDEIGDWIIKTACAQNKVWQDMGFPPIRMGINISFIQFKDSKLVEKISDVLEKTSMSPKYLDIEITESTAILETAYILDSLTKLKKLGIHISIDDFGKEYSSLSRLKLLPFDRIKMDMQFVHGIDESEKDQAYANLIINLANNLGLTLIAEGVETFTQLEFLKSRGCDEVQGYYYYKPMPASELETLFKEKYKSNQS